MESQNIYFSFYEYNQCVHSYNSLIDKALLKYLSWPPPEATTQNVKPKWSLMGGGRLGEVRPHGV